MLSLEICRRVRVGIRVRLRDSATPEAEARIQWVREIALEPDEEVERGRERERRELRDPEVDVEVESRKPEPAEGRPLGSRREARACRCARLIAWARCVGWRCETHAGIMNRMPNEVFQFETEAEATCWTRVAAEMLSAIMNRPTTAKDKRVELEEAFESAALCADAMTAHFRNRSRALLASNQVESHRSHGAQGVSITPFGTRQI